jgi:hypothetical protein
MSSERPVCTIEVLLDGHPHQVVVSGNNSTVLGFEPTGSRVSEPIPLRVRCDVCNAVAKLAFSPPAASWSRPYVVRSVIHPADE